MCRKCCITYRGDWIARQIKLCIDIKYNTTALPDLLENISSPTVENGSQEKSKLCIDIKYNTALPTFLENTSLSEEETGLQDKSKLCINTKLYTVVLYSK